MSEELGVTVKRSEDFSRWYLEVVRKGGFVDQRAPAKGFDVIMPWGYAVWERMQTLLDAELKRSGVRNAYFPLVIPESLIRKEEEHFESFKAQALAVTEAGGSPLEEKLYIRPTSETIMYYMYALWVRSHRDLPLLINQWNNVVRYDTKVTRPFVRGREFLWQEGHTCHATREDSDEWVKRVIAMYDKIYDALAMSRLLLVRPKHDTFPGADYSVVFDTLAQDGRVIQGPGTHNLGQNFSKPFEIKFLDAGGAAHHVWQTSWGMSTRQVGVLIMHHGDDRGAVLPPAVAPVQAVIVPIPAKGSDAAVSSACRETLRALEALGIRAHLDDREHTPGFKFNDWELRGVPLRIEIGPREAERSEITIAKRTGGKVAIAAGSIKEVVTMLAALQKELRAASEAALKKGIKDFRDAKKLASHKGIGRIEWCGDAECADNIKAESGGFEIRGMRFDVEEKPSSACIWCGRKAQHVAYAAKAY